MSRFLMSLAARFPLAILHALGALLGWAIYGLSPTYRRHLRENLEAAGYADDAATRRAAIAGAGRHARRAARGLAAPARRGGRAGARASTAASTSMRRAPPARASCSSRRTWAASRSPRRSPRTSSRSPCSTGAPKIAWLQPLIEQGRARRQRAPGARRPVGRARAARRARAQRSGGHPPRPGAGRGRGRVGGILRQARLHDDAGAPSSRRAPGSVCLLAYGERLPRGAGYVLHIRPLPAAEPGETADAAPEPRARGADPRMPGAVPLGLQPLQAAAAVRPKAGAGPVTQARSSRCCGCCISCRRARSRRSATRWARCCSG